MQKLIDLLEGPEWNEIEPFLFLGSVKAFRDKPFMKKIVAVVSITRISTEEFGLPDRISISQGNHLDICLADHEEANISRYFEESYRFIQDHVMQGHSVFVHCAAGISRSATLVTAYLMKRYQWSAYEALELVKKKRSCVRPNDGFLEQLLQLERR